MLKQNCCLIRLTRWHRNHNDLVKLQTRWDAMWIVKYSLNRIAKYKYGMFGRPANLNILASRATFAAEIASSTIIFVTFTPLYQRSWTYVMSSPCSELRSLSLINTFSTPFRHITRTHFTNNSTGDSFVIDSSSDDSFVSNSLIQCSEPFVCT